MIIGYARVSTEEQHLDLQLDALEEAGCDRIYKDQGISAVIKHRAGFEDALKALHDGDTIVIWKMDRAFRSLRHALDVLEEFERRKIQFCSLTDQLDTTTPMGKCMYQIRNAFAELERSLISERTKKKGVKYHVDVYPMKASILYLPSCFLLSFISLWSINHLTIL